LSLTAIETLSQIPQWRVDAGLSATNLLDAPGVIDNLVQGLREESSLYDGIGDLPSLRTLLRNRIKGWARYVNGDPQAVAPPEAPLALGIPLFRLAAAVRRSASCEQPFRLFLLVDQYESLYQRRNVIDFRPIFNQAMYLASRGGTGVEFKIGTRHYSYRNLDLPDGAGRIEASREMREVNFDLFARDFYRKFAIELFEKRLGAGRRLSAPERLPAYKPRDEAVRYVAESKEPRHLAASMRVWQALGLSAQDSDRVSEMSGLRRAHPLTATLAAIAITRWLRDGQREPPLHCSAVAERGCPEQMVSYLAQIIASIEARERIGSSAARKMGRHLRSIDDFVRDALQPSLFQLASAYKNQRKYYAGLDSIIALSSNVAIVFIEILRSAYESLILDGKDLQTTPVSPAVQSEAVYRTSANWFGRIAKECDYGEAHEAFLRTLGSALRQVQLAPTAPQPCPNGFSLQGDGAGAGAEGAGEPGMEVDQSNRTPDPRNNARALLRDAVSWGLLEEVAHEDKTRGHGKRQKYYLNRIYCPYFGISEIQKKDPIYIEELETFVLSIREGKLPMEFETLLKKVGLAEAHLSEDGPQRRLFT
jgi:hypothetical protein